MYYLRYGVISEIDVYLFSVELQPVPGYLFNMSYPLVLFTGANNNNNKKIEHSLVLNWWKVLLQV